MIVVMAVTAVVIEAFLLLHAFGYVLLCIGLVFVICIMLTALDRCRELQEKSKK